jgi:Spy/CpxP family protein refolding chaperone
VKLSSLKAVGTLLGVFVLGAASGVGGMFAYTRHEFEEFATQPGTRMQGARLRGLTRALDLTDDQRDKVKSILDRHHGERRAAMTEVMEKCGDPIKKQKASLDAEIRSVLNPDQQKRFDGLSEGQEEQLFRHGHGSPGAPPAASL